MEQFDPKVHVCKFFFQQYGIRYLGALAYPKVSGDLYLNELKIELFDKKEKLLQAFGHPLQEHLEELLPLLHWSDFEKTRDQTEWELKSIGYRDGWGYDFVCMNESGYPLIQNRLGYLYKEKQKPAYEKLLDWVIRTYSGEVDLEKCRKKYKLQF